MLVFVRGTSNTDANGGWQFEFAPRRAGLYTGGGAIDTTYPLMVSSGSTPFGTTFMQCDTGGAIAVGISAFQFNSEFNTTALTSLVSERLVAAGVRFRYMGAETLMGGVVHCLEEPNHNSLSNLPLTTFNQYESYFSMPVEKKWIQLVYTPVNPKDYVYDLDYATGYVVNRDSHYMGAIMVGAPAGVAIQFEAMAIFEIVGSAVRDQVQAKSDMLSVQVAANHVTPNNQQLINTTAGGVSNVFNGIKSAGTEFSSVVDTVSKVAKTVGEFASMAM